MRFALIAACALWATLCGVLPGHADKRVALVIGNSNYQHAGRLPNPVNDAAAIGALLKASGFMVVESSRDSGIAQMRRAISNFADTARDSDIAVVYYAGHGIEVDGVNYLVPVDAVLARDFDVEDETISLDRVLRAVEPARRLRLVILDSCRNNPFVETMKRSSRAIGRGFARVEPATPDTLVAFAAKAGSTASDGHGEHSPFTTALLQHLASPGLDVRLALGEVRDAVMASTSPRQEPFVYGSLGGRTISLVEGPAGGATVSDPASQAWAASKDTESPKVLEDFIRRYGDSFYATLARARLEQLKQTQTAVVVPPAIMPRPTPVLPVVASPPLVPPPVEPCSGPLTVSLPSGCAAPLSEAQERGLQPKNVFRECANCPEMVVVAAGSFTMGSAQGDTGRGKDEGPLHLVTLRQPFAVGKFEVTVDQFAAFVAETRYDYGSTCHVFEAGKFVERAGRSWRDPGFPQDGSHPAACLNWNDAKAYVAWLAKTTGRPYRLLSEAEWEYAARGTTAPGLGQRYSFGDDEKAMCRYGNGADQTAKNTLSGSGRLSIFACIDSHAYTAPVGNFSPNAFGLHDMHGNVWEWVEDCYHDDYSGAPADGAARTSGDCSRRVLRGGSWIDDPGALRSAFRHWSNPGDRIDGSGLRVSRTLSPL